jgi:hypothetical protein
MAAAMLGQPPVDSEPPSQLEHFPSLSGPQLRRRPAGLSIRQFRIDNFEWTMVKLAGVVDENGIGRGGRNVIGERKR